jgi:hypothetical protein
MPRRSGPLAPPVPSTEDYYRDPHVRARMLEYCGATSGRPGTAAYLAALATSGAQGPTWEQPLHVPTADMASVWARGADVARSLWDSEHLIVLLDLDYQNADYPGEAFLHPADVLLKLEPAYRATMAVFHRLHLQAHKTVTGRGYHVCGQVPLSDPLVDRLARIVPAAPSWYGSHLARRPSGVSLEMSERQARASAGLGCLLEYAAHLILQEARGAPVPVVVNGTVVGKGTVGRECVSIDFSHVGDPLDVRHMRVAFGAYQWHRLRPDIFGPLAASVPPLAAIPRGRQSLATLLMHGRGLDRGMRAARGTSAVLPNVSRGVSALLARYERSTLATFHRTFYVERQHNLTSPPLDLAALPPCLSAALLRPNDLLLKPEHIQHLVRGLLARGWSAAEIAALVQAKYESDHGWGDRWARLDPQTRAEFDVRVFAGMAATGADTLIDFNCVSAQEKNICPLAGCHYDLRVDRDRLAAHAP